MTSNRATKTVARRRCKAKNVSGKPCRTSPLRGQAYCAAHHPEAAKYTEFKAGVPGPGSGRPRVERPTEVAVRMIEERLQPLIENHLELALEKMYDPGVRRAAGKDLLQYGLGMPTQRTEVSGPGGGPVSIASLVVSLSGAAEAARAAANGSMPDIRVDGHASGEPG